MADRSTVHHPIFARFYTRVAAAADRMGAAEHRTRLLAELAGRVVEVGAGNGLNFEHYPSSVVEVVAVEPDRYLRARAEVMARRVDVRVIVVGASAGALPLADACLDAGVASLVLCSVPGQREALAELHRVIRPDGELRFYEHVLASDARWARRQRRADPIWSRLAGGCHLSRETERAITDSGFEIEDCARFWFRPSWLAALAAPHILGRARRA